MGRTTRYGIEIDIDSQNFSVPESLERILSYFLGRLKRELGKPFEMDEVILAYMKAMDHTAVQIGEYLSQAVKEADASGEDRVRLTIRMDSFFQILKAEAIRLFSMGRESEPELKQPD
jgi:hypothetical protein